MTYSWRRVYRSDIDYITESEKLLELGEGNKYVQGSVILPVDRASQGKSVFTDKATREGLKWLEAHDIKPMYQIYDGAKRPSSIKGSYL